MKNPKVSFFSGSIKNTRPTKDITIGEFLNQVKYGTFSEVVNQIRGTKDPDQRKDLKYAILPYITTTGTYKKRNAAGMKEHSGLWAVDIDGLKDESEFQEMWKLLVADQYTFAAFRSVSSLGICVIVRISTDQTFQKDHERFIQKYYFDSYGVSVDDNALGYSRARFVSHDPDLFINTAIVPMVGKIKEKKRKAKPVNWVATSSQMDRIVSEIHNFHPDFADDYGDYLMCAMAIAHEYGEQGRDYFHAVSSGSSKYDARKCDRKYDNAVSHTDGRTTIGSFFYLCKKNSIELYTKEERDAYSIALNAKKSKSNVEGALSTCEAMSIPIEVAEPIAEMVFERDDIKEEDTEGSTIVQIISFLNSNTDTIFNMVTKDIEHRDSGERIDDRFIQTLYVQAKLAIGDKVRKSDVIDVIEGFISESINPFDEWKAANEHLPERPEVIQEFIDLLELKDNETKSFIRSWLLGIPATMNREVVRLVLCFIGGQEDGKTEWFRRLLPDELKKYFAESDLLHGNPADRDILMSSKLIILDDEMGGKSKKDAQQFKMIASKEKLDFRKAFGRYNEYRHRLSLLCGTTNDGQIVSDATGNTRILPIELSKAYDFETYNNFDKNQLLIEICRAYDRGESWKLDDRQREILGESSSNYSVIDIEEEMLDRFFERPTFDLKTMYYTASEIKDYIESRSSQRLTTNKLGIHLKNKFERISKRFGRSSRRVYAVQFTDIESGSESEFPQLPDNQEDTQKDKKAPW